MENPLIFVRQTVGRLYGKSMAPVMARFDLSRMALDVLLFLSNNPQHDTAAEIVALRDLTKSHVSKAVELLTDRGLMTQQHDETNRRRIHLTLTDAAAPIIDAGRAAQQDFIRTLTQGLSEEELAVLQHVLHTAIRNVHAALGDEPVADA